MTGSVLHLLGRSTLIERRAQASARQRRKLLPPPLPSCPSPPQSATPHHLRTQAKRRILRRDHGSSPFDASRPSPIRLPDEADDIASR